MKHQVITKQMIKIPLLGPAENPLVVGREVIFGVTSGVVFGDVTCAVDSDVTTGGFVVSFGKHRQKKI
jgi:hypothetical protein